MRARSCHCGGIKLWRSVSPNIRSFPRSTEQIGPTTCRSQCQPFQPYQPDGSLAYQGIIWGELPTSCGWRQVPKWDWNRRCSIERWATHHFTTWGATRSELQSKLEMSIMLQSELGKEEEKTRYPQTISRNEEPVHYAPTTPLHLCENMDEL